MPCVLQGLTWAGESLLGVFMAQPMAAWEVPPSTSQNSPPVHLGVQVENKSHPPAFGKVLGVEQLFFSCLK